MEIELKLACEPDQQAALSRHPALAGLAVDVREMHSRYLDTPEHDLRRQGVALRLRHTGRGWVQTLKAEGESAGALSRRHEWEVDLPGPQVDISLFPDKARALLADIDPARLQTMFETRFRRDIRVLDVADARIELALDDGKVKAGRRHARIHEVELELKKGSPEALFALALRLAEDIPLTFEPASKAQRGWQLAGVPLPPPVKARALPAPQIKGDAHQAWQAMLQSGLVQLSANFAGTVTGADPEYLHQLRVAVRRLLSVAQLAEDIDLPAPAWVDALKGVMDAAAVVRDWDVFIANTLPRLVSAVGHALGPLDLPAQKARAAAQDALIQQLRTPEFTRALLWLGQDAVRPFKPGKLSPQAWARGVLEDRRQRARKLLKRYDTLDAGQRHRLRLRIKRLRYTADAFAMLWPEAAPAYMEILGHLQDGLGVANDQAVAERLLNALTARGKPFAEARGMALAALAHLPLPDDLPQLCDRLRRATPFWRDACC